MWSDYWPCQLLHVACSLTTRQSESQLEPGWLWNFVFLTSAGVVRKSIHLAVTVLSVNEHQTEMQDTVTSRVRDLPARHGINVNPSRRLLSERLRPDGSLDNSHEILLWRYWDGGVLQFCLELVYNKNYYYLNVQSVHQSYPRMLAVAYESFWQPLQHLSEEVHSEWSPVLFELRTQLLMSYLSSLC